jgi:hypothetical protein
MSERKRRVGGHLETSALSSLIGLSEPDWAVAPERFQTIRPFVEDIFPLAEVARNQGISIRTAWYRVERYRGWAGGIGSESPG